MKMLGAVSRGPDLPFSLEELELHGPRPDEVLVRLVATGFCHTDVVIKSMFPPAAGPVLLGHEGSGIVEEVGSEVTGIKAGDQVLLSFSSCGFCSFCKAQSPAYCLDFSSLNLPALRPDGSAKVTSDGAPVLSSFFGQSSFASHVLVSPRNVIVVDPDLDLVTLAPLGCGIQTGAGAVLNVLKPRSDSTFVIFGAGAVGLSALMSATSLGVATIVAVDPVESRRDLASTLGANAVLDPAEGEILEKLMELTGGGASHALDTTGIPEVIAEAVRALGTRGALVVVGLGTPEITIDVQDMLGKGKSIRGCIEGDSDPQIFIPTLIDLHAQGLLPLDQIVTRYSFAQINEAVTDAAIGRTVKPVLVF